MLSHLKIENIAIIERAEIEFGDGLNVLTGETGAGKSILIDAIHAVLGERTSRDLIRSDAGSAKVSALFYAHGQSIRDTLREYELPVPEDGELLLQRTLQTDGRNVCRINGETVSVSMLKAVGRDLINIHGQHDNQALLNAERHFSFLDLLASNAALLEAYRAQYQTLGELRREQEALRMDETQKERELDMLQFQIDELESADLQIGEQEELSAKRSLHQNSEKVLDALQSAYAALRGDEDMGGAVDSLETAADDLEAAAAYFTDVEETAANVRSLAYDLAEYTSEVRDALESFSYDPQELAEIEERLDLLYRLSRKYGTDEEEMLQFLADAVEKRERITLSDQRIKELDALITKAEAAMLQNAQKLHGSRVKAARDLEEQVTRELAFLDMPNVTFCVQMTPCTPNANGTDRIEFLISANAGEEPRPLAKIASGGELSRMMLAIKNVLADKDDIGTLIFDEIDTGVSGRAAQKIALKLHEVANGRQVICVTHLAQIAAQAKQHLQIYKEVADGKTYTRVHQLNHEGRKQELARIIGGLEVTQLQLDSAAEMLKAAGN